MLHLAPLTGTGIAFSAVALIIFLILNDRLMTKGRHQEALDLKDAVIKDLIQQRDDWRDVALGTTNSTRLLAQVSGAFVEVGQTASQLIAAMPPVAVAQVNSVPLAAAPSPIPQETPHVAT